MKKKEAYTVSDERKTGDLQAVSRTILPFARSILGQKGFVEVDMIANWDKIVGEELTDYVFPQRIEFKRGEKTDGVLHVAVPGGAFALELQHREKLLLAKVNSYFGYCAVSRLKIIQNAEILPLAEKPVQRSEKNLVTREEENYIRQLSEDIRNPALQEIVDTVLARCEDQAQQYRDGNQKVLGFLVGQCMKESRGKGNPKLFNELLRASLS